jgi:hypothetical protein
MGEGLPMLSQPSSVALPKRHLSGCQQRGHDTPTNVLRSFNTWAFKREQPSDANLIRQIISESISRQEPVPFVLYWGKGPRDGIGSPDVHCLDYLLTLVRRIGVVYERGAALTLVFTDTHAELNGHSQRGISQYFEAIDQAAGARHFRTCWLSQLLAAHRHANTTFDLSQYHVPEAILARLTISARKWYHGKDTFEEGARRYFGLNMVERKTIEAAFPRSIFITFNGSELRALFPDHLPIFYMYSLRRGTSVKPWFIPDTPS